MAGTLRITDLVSFSYLSHDWGKVRDDYEGAFAPQRNPGPTHPSGMGTIGQMAIASQDQQQTGQGLNIQIAATHSGIITRNNGFYLPDRMRKGAETFTKDYPKPVLLHHEDHKDPVGRIIDAAYVDTSGSIQDKYKGLEVRNKAGKVVGKITDSLINDFTNSNMPFGQQVDVVRSILRDSSMLEDAGYQGLGYIKLLANITDPDAIQKLLDGRYITGSVGATTNKAVCSVCRTDWTDNGPCEHKPGGVYDDAKCFIIAGDLVYDEYSFVNVPADRHSRVLQLDYNGNHTEIEVVNDYKGRIYEVQLEFPQYGSDDKEEKGMAKNAKKTEDNKSADNLEIKDSATPAPDAEGTEQGAQETVADSATDGEAKTEGKGDDIVVQDDTKPEGEEQVQDAKTDDDEESIQDFVVRVLDSEEDPELSDEDHEKLYDYMWSEVQAAVKDGDLPLSEEELEDAKLSTEKRNKLPKSSFCGPGRSFPVPDCAHVTAAKRLIGRAKASAATKEKIMACVNRKAKAMGCGSSKKTDQVQDDAKTTDDLNHSRMLRMMLSVLDEDTYYSQEPVLADDEKKMLQSIIKRMASLVGKDAFTQALYTEGVAQDESVLLDEVAKLEDTVGELKDRLEATQKEHHLLFKDMEDLQDQLASQIADGRKAKEAHLSTLAILRDKKVEDETNFTEISDSDLDSEISKTLELVDMAKIADKLGDGLSRVPEGSIEDPTEIQDNQDQKSKVTAEGLNNIYANFMQLKMSRGNAAAEAYLADCKRRGFLPHDLENIQGGTN